MDLNNVIKYLFMYENQIIVRWEGIAYVVDPSTLHTRFHTYLPGTLEDVNLEQTGCRCFSNNIQDMYFVQTYLIGARVYSRDVDADGKIIPQIGVLEKVFQRDESPYKIAGYDTPLTSIALEEYNVHNALAKMNSEPKENKGPFDGTESLGDMLQKIIEKMIAEGISKKELDDFEMPTSSCNSDWSGCGY